MNVIVDTCVIIDALQQREPFAKDAQDLCLAVAKGKISAFIPAKSVADIYHIMHRSLHSDEQTRVLLKKLFLSFGILDTTALDCRNALTSPVSDFEDAILAEKVNPYVMEYPSTSEMTEIKIFSGEKHPSEKPNFSDGCYAFNRESDFFNVKIGIQAIILMHSIFLISLPTV
ncbi:MAG: PIN domain-containing protein [Ruminococcus sp.]|nr:PIN domain-containing protein [Ruminococcus sp.]